MGTTAAAARRCLLSAHQDLEGIERPELRGQKNAVLDLYEQCPENGAVICFDECGPLELRPLAGKGWFRSGHPQRFRVSYRRLQGTEQLLAFSDVHADCLVGQVRKHKRVDDLLAVFARLRACYPMDGRLYVVMDNLRWHIARSLTWRNKEKGSSKAALAQFSRVRLYRH